MQKLSHHYRATIAFISTTVAAFLSMFQAAWFVGDLQFSAALSLFFVNMFCMSFALLFLLEAIMMKKLGHSLFGNENRKVQSSIIHRLTFTVFALIFFNAQSLLIKGSNTYVQNLTEAFFFALFLSGGIVYMMFWGLNSFIQNKKEKQKETIRLHGVSYVDNYMDATHQLDKTLYALSGKENMLSEETIVRINQKTKELYSVFPVIEKMSPSARKEVEQEVFDAVNALNQELETILFSKDAEYMEFVRRKTRKINRKTVR